jgi:hypothetical protein
LGALFDVEDFRTILDDTVLFGRCRALLQGEYEYTCSDAGYTNRRDMDTTAYLLDLLIDVLDYAVAGGLVNR